MDNLVYYVYVPILGILIAALLHSLNTRYHEQRRIFNDVAKETRDAFKLEMIELLSAEVDLRTCEILIPAFGKQQTTIMTFMQVLAKREKNKLTKIWNEYCEIYYQDSRKYELITEDKSAWTLPVTIDWEKEEEIRTKSITLIKEIFELTKLK